MQKKEAGEVSGNIRHVSDVNVYWEKKEGQQNLISQKSS